MPSSLRRVNPYFYPSTAVIIDDDCGFLDSFRSRFRRSLLCRTFDDPEDAVRYIRRAVSVQPRHAGCIVPGDIMSSDGDQSLLFRPGVICDLMKDANRFQEISVVVIDYDMPRQNGLEVCRALKEIPVGKLMLTGAADEKLAMAAFNEGLIDRFVLKHDGEMVDQLGTIIRDLQFAYFERIGADLSSIVGLQESAFLTDPAFCAHFNRIFEQENAVEYFLSDNPSGVLLVRADGTVRTLLVQHFAALTVYSVAVRGQPPGLSERVSAGDCQPWFPTPFGFYAREFYNSWEKYLYPAERIGPWYCSVIEDECKSGSGRKQKRSVPSYQDYRRKLYQDAA